LAPSEIRHKCSAEHLCRYVLSPFMCCSALERLSVALALGFETT
jgi:hypothetical protein